MLYKCENFLHGHTLSTLNVEYALKHDNSPYSFDHIYKPKQRRKTRQLKKVY